MEREFFDLGEQSGLHFADADAFVAHFGFGGNAGKMAVLADVGVDLG